MDHEKRKQNEAARRRVATSQFEAMSEIEQGEDVLIDALREIVPAGNLRLFHINQHLRRKGT